MTDQRGTESTQTEILERIKALRTPMEPEGQPEEGGAVDVSVETPDESGELQSEEVERQTVAEQTDETLPEPEEPAETLESSDPVKESQDDDIVYDIGGREITLKRIEELEKGQMKDADYTQKTQKVAEQRKALEASQSKQQEILDSLQSHIDLATEMIDSEFEGVDWDELRDLDTGEYLKLKEKKEGRQGKLEAAKAKRQELINSRLLENQTKGNQELVDLNPQWVSDGQTTQAYKDDQTFLSTFAENNKLTSDEISAILTSGKIMQAMIDSAKYRANIAKAPALAKQVKKAPVIIKGKRASVSSIDRQIKEATAKLKSTGRVEDAMALQKLKRQLSN